MTAPAAHTVKAFDDDLERLRALVAEMGGLAEAAIDHATQALMRRDSALAARVIAEDGRIDALAAVIEREGVCIIALRAPMADDLREIVSALKIAVLIERLGDFAKHIATRVAIMQDHRWIEPISVLPAMLATVKGVVTAALDAFAARDPLPALAMTQQRRVVNDFYDSLFRALLTHMMEDAQTITPCAHLLFIAQSLERIGDHAAIVAEVVHFSVTGERLRAASQDPDLAPRRTER
ncbi:phosphate signaling complex protein PhoU [Allosphingosinicella flava]|uniref:phosphate signaling complex protein PhoU n=1 Tax=Allosphingosinicella flava TaxID=2771430 RepID=UPI001CF7C84D|nr:phosphate signaling complex protein PhoU [Sphingosinicella flava]